MPPPPPPPGPPPAPGLPPPGRPKNTTTSQPPPDRNAFLKQVHGGVKLKKAVTNDRSAPKVDGSKTSSAPAAGGLFNGGVPALPKNRAKAPIGHNQKASDGVSARPLPKVPPSLRQQAPAQPVMPKNSPSSGGRPLPAPPGQRGNAPHVQRPTAPLPPPPTNCRQQNPEFPTKPSKTREEPGRTLPKSPINSTKIKSAGQTTRPCVPLPTPPSFNDSDFPPPPPPISNGRCSVSMDEADFPLPPPPSSAVTHLKSPIINTQPPQASAQRFPQPPPSRQTSGSSAAQPKFTAGQPPKLPPGPPPPVPQPNISNATRKENSIEVPNRPLPDLPLSRKSRQDTPLPPPPNSVCDKNSKDSNVSSRPLPSPPAIGGRPLPSVPVNKVPHKTLPETPPRMSPLPPAPNVQRRISKPDMPLPPAPSGENDDFEGKFTFHGLNDFPDPDQFSDCSKTYPSKNIDKAKVANRQPPPAPPV